MSSKSKSKGKKKKLKKPPFKTHNTDALTRTLISDYEEVKEELDNHVRDASCPVCLGTVQTLENHCDTLIKAMALSQQYNENPEEAKALFVSSQTLLRRALKNATYFMRNTRDHTHRIFSSEAQRMQGPSQNNGATGTDGQ